VVTVLLQVWEETCLPGLAQEPEETQTHRSNIPGKFANHQVVGKAGVSHAEHGIW